MTDDSDHKRVHEVMKRLAKLPPKTQKQLKEELRAKREAEKKAQQS